MSRLVGVGAQPTDADSIEQLQETIDKMNAGGEKLYAEFKLLEETNGNLISENSTLQAENKKLKAEIEKLKK